MNISSDERVGKIFTEVPGQPVTLRVVKACPVVSVVLPIWNGQRFLAEAVESVLSQTLSELELIIVDDGSTDGTLAIARDFARRDPRVKVVGLDHVGIANALNAGVVRARGRYVARMDGDDISRPVRLAKQVSFLEANTDCVAVGCAIEVVDEAAEHLGVRMFPERHGDIVHTLIRTWSTAIAHPTVMTRRSVLWSVGGYRPDRVPCEDLDLWIRLSRVGKLANLPDPLLRYRRHCDTVGIRDHAQQWTVGAAIVNEARRSHGLRPLRPRVPAAVRSRVASYHLECARIALISGSRGAAVRHARAAIASEPSWTELYVALAACVFPKWTVRSVNALRHLAIAAALALP